MSAFYGALCVLSRSQHLVVQMSFGGESEEVKVMSIQSVSNAEAEFRY